MYVDAEILVSDDSVYAVPEGAVLKQEDKSFVIIYANGKYEVETVDTGARMDGWVEIRNAEALRNKSIVTEGASRLFPALQKGG